MKKIIHIFLAIFITLGLLVVAPVLPARADCTEAPGAPDVWTCDNTPDDTDGMDATTNSPADNVTIDAGATVSNLSGDLTTIDMMDGSLINNGTVSNNETSGAAIFASGDSDITNNGTISASGESGTALFTLSGDVTNVGSVQADGLSATGILTDTGNVVNNGTVSTNGDSGTGLLTDTGNNTVTNNGTVSATGSGGVAILTGPGNDTVTIGSSAMVHGLIDGGTDTDILAFEAFSPSQLAGLNPAAGTFGGYSWVNFEQLTGLLYEPVANVEVTIGGIPRGSYDIPSGSRISPIYPGINNGPVQVSSTNGANIIVSERAYRGLNYTDWNEMLGFPADQLTTEYWFPLCDGTGGAQTFISIGNASQTPAEVTVKIAGQLLGSYTIPVGGRVTPDCMGINNGPVQVYSTNGTDIIVSERAYRGANFTDWNEMMGLPVEQLTTEYWFPLCDGTGTAQTFISIGNASQTPAQVTVKIAGQILGNYTIPVGGRVTPNCAGINNGPVQVYSTNGTDLIVSERAYRGPNYTDWNEMLGLPVEQLTTQYWFPLCDGTGTSQTFISIGNASQTPAEVSVKIAGQLLGSYTIPVGGRVTPMCTGINNGPVQVYSTNGTDLIVSERAYRGANYTDWNEMLGLPVEQLTTEYWFPLYDSTRLAQTFISIGAP